MARRDSSQRPRGSGPMTIPLVSRVVGGIARILVRVLNSGEDRHVPFGEVGSKSARNPSSPSREIRLLTVDEIENLPDTDWLLGNVIPSDGFCVLYGEPGVGKSFWHWTGQILLQLDEGGWTVR